MAAKIVASTDPQCVALTMLLFALIRTFVIPRLSGFLIRLNRPDDRLTLTDRIKIRISLWKSLYNGTAAIYGISYLYSQNWLLNSDLYGHRYDELPATFKIHYLVSFSFYLNELAWLCIEPRRKDFFEMVIHHISTITLLWLSYVHNLTRFGVLILVLHDVADPLLESAKTCVKLSRHKLANVLFYVFALVFFSTRNVIYPIFLVYPASKHLLHLPWSIWSMAILIMLNVLVLLHIIWLYFIYKMAVRLIVLKDDTDVRSDEAENTNMKIK